MAMCNDICGENSLILRGPGIGDIAATVGICEALPGGGGTIQALGQTSET